MDLLRQRLSEFWEWVPKWQFYGVLGLAVALWVVRQYALSRVVLVVAGVAWFVGFVVQGTDMGKGLGANVLNFAMLSGGVVAVVLAWYFFVRRV